MSEIAILLKKFGSEPDTKHEIKVPEDWIEITEMTKSENGTTWIKYRLVPRIQKIVDARFTDGNRNRSYYASPHFSWHGAATIRCFTLLAELLLGQLGYIYPLAISRRSVEYIANLIVDEFDGEDEAVVLQKQFVGVVMARNKELTTLLAVRAPECILMSDRYELEQR